MYFKVTIIKKMKTFVNSEVFSYTIKTIKLNLLSLESINI